MNYFDRLMQPRQLPPLVILPDKTDDASAQPVTGSGGVDDNPLGHVSSAGAYRDVTGATFDPNSETGGYIDPDTGRLVVNVVGDRKQEPDHKDDVHPGAIHSAILGAEQGLTLNSADEADAALGATGDSIANLIGIGNGKDWSQNFGDREHQNQAVLDAAANDHPGYYYPGEIAGGLAPALLTDGASAALEAGNGARIVGEGASIGGISGFAGDNGDLQSRLASAGNGAIGGGILGGVVGVPLNAIARRVAGNIAEGGNAGRRVIQAADRLNASTGSNIRPIVANTSHGGLGSHVSAMLDGTLTGGLITGLNRNGRNVVREAGNAADSIANREAGGVAQDITSTAENQISGAPGTLGNHLPDERAATQRVYRQADAAAGNVQIRSPETVHELDQMLAEWHANPATDADGPIRQFEALRDRLASGNVTVAGARDMRRDLGKMFGQDGHSYASEAAKRLYGPITNDIQTGLRAAGRNDSANLYRQADRQWAIMQGNRSAIEKIVGTPEKNLGADTVANNLVNMSQKDGRNFRRAMDAIDPSQAQQIRGSLIHQMGRATAGRATEPGEFSLSTFTTNWNKLSDQAKRTAGFSPETIRDLDDLATIGHSARAAGQLGNHSRTEYTRDGIETIKSVGKGVWDLGAAAGSHAIGVTNPHILAGMVGVAATGGILARPGVARAMVTFANSGNTIRTANMLRRIATRDPAIAGSLGQVIDALNEGTSTPVASPKPAQANPFDHFDNHSDTVDLGDPVAQGPAQNSANPFDQFDSHDDTIELK